MIRYESWDRSPVVLTTYWLRVFRAARRELPDLRGLDSRDPRAVDRGTRTWQIPPTTTSLRELRDVAQGVDS